MCGIRYRSEQDLNAVLHFQKPISLVFFIENRNWINKNSGKRLKVFRCKTVELDRALTLNRNV